MLQLSESDVVRRAVVAAPVSSAVVQRYVPGPEIADAVRAAEKLRTTGRLATIDYLGEYTQDLAQARHTKDTYLRLLAALSERGLTAHGVVEVSVKLSAVGQSLAQDGERVALEHAREICAAAGEAGTTVTIDMEDHTTTDSTLGIVRELRADFPWVGAVLQSYLHRTEADCAELVGEGSRVRLCKGAYKEPASVAFQDREEVDLAYVRCLKILMEGDGYPMIATHDPRLIEITRALAGRLGRSQDTYELQMLGGIRPVEQVRIADRGQQMRVYLPFGEEWYGYLVRRMAERPANTVFFVRSLLSRT
jgi:proline dehydrogenase